MSRRFAARILIITENEAQYNTWAEALLKSGCETLQASSSSAGVERVEQGGCDLVILRLEELDRHGLTACHRIKSGTQAHVPIIVVSRAFHDTKARAKGLAAGADVCLAEPVGGAELLAQLCALLRVREVEMALRQSEERFRLATEAMQGSVYEWDIGSGIARRSVGIAELLGWRLEELPLDSEWWPQQIHPEDVQRVQHNFLTAVARQASSCQHEYRIRHKDGHYLWIWDSNRIVYDALGTATRVIGCAVSIDERKRAEKALHNAKEELAQANERLEAEVEKRTHKLIEMVAELESWSYSIAHDMRAPLRTMHNFSTFLLEEYGARLDPIGRDYIDRIVAATQRLDDYLRDLLVYGKMGRSDLPLRPVNVALLLNDILSSYPNLQPPNCSIELQQPLPVVQANPSALTQVLANLLDNAVKFAKEGTTPKVEIRAEQKQDRIRLWVEDNGIGIDKKAQQRLFTMFQRLHSLGDYPGTGMGLAIVRRAVERMGGAVGVESEPQRGSRFWVELKAA